MPGTNSANCSYDNYELGQRQVTAQLAKNAQGSVESYESPYARNPYSRSNENARRNAAMTNGYRSCQFRSQSGF